LSGRRAVATAPGAKLTPGVIHELGIGEALGLPTLILFLIAADDDLPMLLGDLRLCGPKCALR